MQAKIKITSKGKIFDGKHRAVISQNLYAAMQEAVLYLEREVKERTPVGARGAKGGLRASIAGTVSRGRANNR